MRDSVVGVDCHFERILPGRNESGGGGGKNEPLLGIKRASNPSLPFFIGLVAVPSLWQDVSVSFAKPEKLQLEVLCDGVGRLQG